MVLTTGMFCVMILMVMRMIIYRDILKKLSDAGWSTYKLQKERIMPNSAIMQIRSGKPITTTTLNTVCKLTGLQPGDLLAYVPDEQEN